MRRYSSSFGPVELTDERLRHILIFHPELRAQVKHFAAILISPAIICCSKTDTKVFIHYKLLRKKKYLAIVVKTNHRNFILTAYLTTKIQHKPL